MEEEIIIKENDLIRIYSIEERKMCFDNKEYISKIDLIDVPVHYNLKAGGLK